MSPLDDQLRNALHARADVLAPAPDPLAGIEQRARGLRRRRLAAAVAGSAVAVSLVAVGIPVLQDAGARTHPAPLASTGPSPNDDRLPEAPAPLNVLGSWPERGADGPATQDVLTRFAEARGQAGTAAQYRPLFSGRTASGVRYTVGQAWLTGESVAHTVGLATGGANGPEFFLGPETPAHPHVLALAVTDPPHELLVVVPEPQTTQVLYDTDATGAFTPKDSPGLDGVVLIDRAPSSSAATDRLQLLTGNGDPATDVTFQGPVTSLLCGASGCG